MMKRVGIRMTNVDNSDKTDKEWKLIEEAENKKTLIILKDLVITMINFNSSIFWRKNISKQISINGDHYSPQVQETNNDYDGENMWKLWWCSNKT